MSFVQNGCTRMSDVMSSPMTRMIYGPQDVVIFNTNLVLVAQMSLIFVYVKHVVENVSPGGGTHGLAGNVITNQSEYLTNLNIQRLLSLVALLLAIAQ